MDAYTEFAQVYDLFMDDVPYEEWGNFLLEQLRQAGIREGILLDLGCGTGRLTRFFAGEGYDMIGVDNSPEMLQLAKEAGEKEDILYLLQDMRNFELYGTVAAVYSACDSLNYILEEEELLAVFRLVNNYLDPGGLFLFDMNTPYKYEELLGENTFAENRSEGSFIWENYYDEKSGINEYDLTLFIRQEEMHFLRFQETHYQRNYAPSVIRRLLEEAQLTLLSVYDAYTAKPLRRDSERMLFIAKRI